MKSIAPIAHYLVKKGMQVLVTTLTLSSSKLFPTIFNKILFSQIFTIGYYIPCRDFLKGWKPSIVLFVDSREFIETFYLKLKKKKYHSYY